MKRLEARFAKLRAEGRAGFVAYVMAGDPGRDASLDILRGLPAAGADLIELGFPFSDPMAEGPTIQRAAQRSLKAGTTLADTLALAAAFRGARPTSLTASREIERVLSAVPRRSDPPIYGEFAEASARLIDLASPRGLQLQGYRHTLDVQSVRHILRRHGDPTAERARGQIAVTMDDFRSLPDLVNEFDYAVFGLSNPQGLPAFALIWEQPSGSTLSLQVVLRGGKRLEAQTMWKWPGGTHAVRLATVLSHNVRNAPQVNVEIVGGVPLVKGEPADTDTPLILMGYLNPLLTYGLDRFAADAAASGVDGLIVVDCPPEEADPLADALDAHGIALIRLAAPTTDDVRLPAVVRRTSGFLYYVSVAGVTGVKAVDAAAVAPAVERLRAASGLPVAVGFGVKTPAQAAAVARVADAVVVGSALVDEVALAVAANEPPAPRVLAKAAELAGAVRAASQREPA